jgi:hypothetical protein
LYGSLGVLKSAPKKGLNLIDSLSLVLRLLRLRQLADRRNDRGIFINLFCSGKRIILLTESLRARQSRESQSS